MKKALALGLCCLLLVAAAGCGGDSDGGGTTTAVGGDNQGSLGPPTALTLTYRKSKRAKAEVARVTCTKDGTSATGYLTEDAIQACEDVDSRSKLLLEGPDLTKACTTIYGGPETFEVSGRVDYKTVEQTFKRTNGCQIDAWNKMVPLMPPGAPN